MTRCLPSWHNGFAVCPCSVVPQLRQRDVCRLSDLVSSSLGTYRKLIPCWHYIWNWGWTHQQSLAGKTCHVGSVSFNGIGKWQVGTYVFCLASIDVPQKSGREVFTVFFIRTGSQKVTALRRGIYLRLAKVKQGYPTPADSKPSDCHNL